MFLKKKRKFLTIMDLEWILIIVLGTVCFLLLLTVLYMAMKYKKISNLYYENLEEHIQHHLGSTEEEEEEDVDLGDDIHWKTLLYGDDTTTQHEHHKHHSKKI